MFQKYFRSDGKTFNVSLLLFVNSSTGKLICHAQCIDNDISHKDIFHSFQIAVPRDKLLQIEHRLQQAIQLYKRRLEWLTTESRRVFGTIEEKSIAIVLDIRNLSPQQFDQYKAALERVVKEQITTLAKFSLIR